MVSKLSEQLVEQLRRSDAPDMLDVIIELSSRDEPKATPAQSRSEKITALKETFSRNVAPVEDAVRKAGGELTGHAWINRTVRARVPIKSVEELSEHEHVAKLDVPHALEPDAVR
jgi:hypothetical protein